jgi:hypothetical protein
LLRGPVFAAELGIEVMEFQDSEALLLPGEVLALDVFVKLNDLGLSGV